MSLPNLAHLVPARTGDLSSGRGEHRDVIATAIANQPRSLQKQLGPSELGTGCDRCLVHMLAGHERRDTTVPWLPYIGTAVHEQLAVAFADANARRPNVRYLVETTVVVGQLRGEDIVGHCDLVDLDLRLVNDWKIVGKTTLDKVQRLGPSDTYRHQGQLYAHGLRARGIPIEHVQITFLPRNHASLDAGHVYTEPYDPAIADAALTRASALAAGVDSLGAEKVLASCQPHTGAEFTCTQWLTDPSTAPVVEVTPDAFLGVS